MHSEAGIVVFPATLIIKSMGPLKVIVFVGALEEIVSLPCVLLLVFEEDS